MASNDEKRRYIYSLSVSSAAIRIIARGSIHEAKGSGEMENDSFAYCLHNSGERGREREKTPNH